MKNRIQNRSVPWIVLLFAVTVFSIGCDRSSPDKFLLLTGTQGGTFEDYGKAIDAAARRLDGTTRLLPMATGGTGDNIKMLVTDDQPSFALISGHGLAGSIDKKNEFLNKAKLVAPLYNSYLQILASPAHVEESAPNTLKELLQTLSARELPEAVRVYAGKPLSGTRPVAVEILATCFPDVTVEIADNAEMGYSSGLAKLSKKHGDGGFDIAFVFAGMPTTSVEQAIESGARLLEFEIDPKTRKLEKCNNIQGEIPAFTYSKQKKIKTLIERNYLVCRTDTPTNAVEATLRSIVEYPQAMQFYHPTAGHTASDVIKLSLADEIGGVVEIGRHKLTYHAGARSFLNELKSATIILGGPLGGRYNEIAEGIARGYRDTGRVAYAIPTDGSLENLNYLSKAGTRRFIALSQYDLAFESTNNPRGGLSEESQSEDKQEFFFIGTLHREFISAYARKGEDATLRNLVLDSAKRIGIGSKNCGAAGTFGLLFAKPQATCDHDISSSKFSQALAHDRLGAVLVVGEPSSAIVRQLSLGGDGIQEIAISKTLAHLARPPAITLDSLGSPQNYSERREPAKQVLATRAVLLASENVARDTECLETVIRTSPSIGFDMKSFTTPLVGLRVSDEFDDARESLGLIDRQSFNWIGWIGALAAAIPALMGLASMGIFIYNGHRAARWTRKALDVDLSARNKKTVRQLASIEESMRSRVGNTFLEIGVLSPQKWSELQGFLRLRREKAEESYQRQIAKDVEHFRGSKENTISELEGFNVNLIGALTKAWKLYCDGELSLRKFQEIESLISGAITYNEGLITARRRT